MEGMNKETRGVGEIDYRASYLHVLFRNINTDTPREAEDKVKRIWGAANVKNIVTVKEGW
jgi:hypothetical protein